MIKIIDKRNCCGCGACEQICPSKCILLENDTEGFLYPKIKKSDCINCQLCEKVCPCLNQSSEWNSNPTSLAVKNLNEKIRKESSSGGIFTLLAEKILKNNGIVFGARFNEKFDVVHDWIDNEIDLVKFRGSKYVQSKIGCCYEKVKEFLEQNREVLFSGTPCQIAGLKRFLQKKYDDLFCLEIICHGVPSPKMWTFYKNELLRASEKKVQLLEGNSKIRQIDFRNKKSGWKKFNFLAEISVGSCDDSNSVFWHSSLFANTYMRGFLSDLYLRPSCHSCPAKKGKSQSDIAIADFWGIENIFPDFDDDKGTSLVLLASEKGKNKFSEIKENCEFINVKYEDGLKGNISIEKSVLPHPSREKFFQKVTQENFEYLVWKFTTLTLWQKICKKINKRINKIRKLFRGKSNEK